MGYKQPGFGNGSRPSNVPTSPLNLLGRKKRQKRREMEGTETRSGVTVSKNQYEGKTNKQIKKLREKAAKRANKAETRAAEGKKLRKRQQDAIAERDYNLKRDKEKQQHKDQKAKNIEEYGGNYGPKARERIDLKRLKEADAENQAAEADASANRFRDPALVASEKRDPAEANTPDIDLVEKKPTKKKGYYSDTKVMNRDRTERAGHRIDFSEADLKDMRFSQKPNKYGLTPSYNQKGEIEYSQNVPQWMTDSGNEKAIAEWSAQMDANMIQRDKDYEAQFGSDAPKENRDYTMLEGYNTHTNRTRKQKNKETWENYAAGNLSEGEMAYRS